MHGFALVAALCATSAMQNPIGFMPPAINDLFLAAEPCEPVQLDDEWWSVESADATCPPVNLPSGVKVVILKESSVELNRVHMTGRLIRGGAYVKTYALPFEITNLNHLVSPDLTVSISIQNDFEPLSVVTSVEGETAVYACEGENASCSNRQLYIIPEGGTLALRPDGSWYAKQTADGKWTFSKSGCQTSDGFPGVSLWLFAALLCAYLRRRRM